MPHKDGSPAYAPLQLAEQPFLHRGLDKLVVRMRLDSLTNPDFIVTSPREYWYTLLNLLFTSGRVGTQGNYPNPDTILSCHESQMQRLIEITSDYDVANTLRVGEVIILSVLTEGELRIPATTFSSARTVELDNQDLRILGGILTQLVDGQYQLRTNSRDTHELDRVRRHQVDVQVKAIADQVEPSTRFAHLERQRLALVASPRVGYAAPVDITRTLDVRQARLEAVIAGYPAELQSDYIRAKLDEAGKFMTTSARQEARAFVASEIQDLLVGESAESLVAGHEVRRQGQIANGEKSIAELLQLLEHPELGIGGRHTVAEALLTDFKNGLLKELITLPWDQQLGYLSQLINSLVKKIDLLNREKPDFSRALFELLEFVLFDSRSPVVANVARREEDGHARSNETLERLQVYYLQQIKSSNSCVAELGYAISAANKMRTPEQFQRYVEHMAAVRQARMVSVTPASISGIYNSFISGTENLNRNTHRALDQDGDLRPVVFEWAVALLTLNPAGFNDLVRQFGGLEAEIKTGRYDQERAAAAQQAVQNGDGIDTTALGYRAGAKLIPSAYPYTVDSRLQGLVNNPDLGQSFVSVVANLDKYSALDSGALKGPLLHWCGEHDDPTVRQSQTEAVRSMLAKSFELIEKSRKSDSQPLRQMAIALLYYWGSALRSLPGDSEVIKSASLSGLEQNPVSLRSGYLNLIIEILSDPDSGEFGEAVRLVLERHLPFWPLEDQEYLLQELVAQGLNNDSKLLTTFIEVSKLLAVNKDGKLPLVSGEDELELQEPTARRSRRTRTSVRRPAAKQALGALSDAVEHQHLANGRSVRESVIAQLLGANDYRDLGSRSATDLRLNPDAFLTSALDLASYIGTADDLELFITQLTTLIQKDAVLMTLELNTPPTDVSIVLERAKTFKGLVEGAISQSVQQLAQLVNGSQKLLLEAPLEFEQEFASLADGLSSEAQTRLARIIEIAKKKYQEMLLNVDPFVTRQVEGALQGQIASVSEGVINQTYSHTVDDQAQAAIATVGLLLSQAQDPNRDVESPTQLATAGASNHGLVLTDLGAGFIPQMMEMAREGSGAGAIAQVVESMIQANTGNQAFVLQLLEQTGELDLVKAQAQLKSQLIEMASQVLTNENYRRELVLQLRQLADQKQQEYLLATNVLLEELNTADLSLSGVEIGQAREEQAAAIGRAKLILEVRQAAYDRLTKSTLAEYQSQIDRAAQQLVGCSRDFGAITNEQAAALRKYLADCLNPRSPVISILTTLQLELNKLGLPKPVTLQIPQSPQEIMGNYTSPSYKKKEN